MSTGAADNGSKKQLFLAIPHVIFKMRSVKLISSLLFKLVFFIFFVNVNVFVYKIGEVRLNRTCVLCNSRGKT